MIHFFSEDVDFVLPDQKKVAHWLEQVALSEHSIVDELSVVFCSDDYLLALNKQHLQHDYYTDVITFDYREGNTNLLEGDVFVSYDRVSDNAAQRGISLTEELLRVMVHGLLHLVGYDDSSKSEKEKMRVLEDKYLANY